MKKLKKMTAILIALVSITTLFAGCSSSDDKNVIRIANKHYTEQRITGQLISVYLQSKGFETEMSELAGTMLCFNALRNKDIDIYPEYTGSAYAAIFKQEKILTADESYEYVKSRCEDEYDITWMEPFGYNDTYILSVTKDVQEKYNLETISDLIPISKDMTIGADSEFVNRLDGLIGLEKMYDGLKFKDAKSMDQGITYQALVDGKLDVNASYSTDGRIAKFGLVNLVDDKNFFPAYYMTPILRVDYAEKNPEVVKALKELGNHWTEEDMQKYNLMVDEGEKVENVATLMLREKGLID